MNDNFEKWITFLKPENLKDNLICCSLYIAIFETTKEFLINQIKEFFSIGWDQETGDIIGEDYKEKVLAKDPKNILNASLIWFKESDAITENDILKFSELRKYRNELAHEMLEKLFEGINKDYPERLLQLVNFRIKIERWWICNIDIPTSAMENISEMKKEDVLSSFEIIFKMIMDIVSGDAEKSSYYCNEFLKYKSQYK